MWWCLGCGCRRGGTACKKKCITKYGDMGAERIPPLDGYIKFEINPEIPEEKDIETREKYFDLKRRVK